MISNVKNTANIVKECHSVVSYTESVGDSSAVLLFMQPNQTLLTDELTYPFGKRWSPEIGQPFEVAKGVYWLRMPLPMSLDHINLWLLKDGERWVIVDTGVDSEECKSVWESVFDSFLDPQKVSKVIVTHFHLDHIGLASWLARRCDCPIHMTQGELDYYRNMIDRDQRQADSKAKQFFVSLGFPERESEKIVSFFSTEEKPTEARVQRDQVLHISEGTLIKIGDRTWRVVTGCGHSPEHACLYSEEDKLLISGDQSLPRISSNVSVFPGNSNLDPLRDWLRSCEKLKQAIPPSALVLPAHQEPFHNNPLRMQQLIDDHLEQLEKLRDKVDSPVSALQASRILFDRELKPADVVLATGETMAHLRYLENEGELVVSRDTEGVQRFSLRSIG